jgi:proteic killer suppression protein
LRPERRLPTWPEPLKGDCAGTYSMRINDEWRVLFVWTGNDADAVEIVDYH